MGRKNVVKSYDMFTQSGGDISAPIVSDVVNVINQDKASIHIVWAGSSPVGEIVVEARNGENDSWYTLDFDTITVTGNSGNHQLIFNELPFTDIRLQYGYTSGTGTITARLTSKVVGA